MASLGGEAQASDDSGRRKPRLAASLQPPLSLPMNAQPPSVGLGHGIWGPVSRLDPDDQEAARQPPALAAGDSWPQIGAGLGDLGAAAAWALEDLGGQMVGAAGVSLPPAGATGDIPEVARLLSLQPQDALSQHTSSLLAQYLASLGVSRTVPDDQLPGEAPGGRLWHPSRRAQAPGCRTASSSPATACLGPLPTSEGVDRLGTQLRGPGVSQTVTGRLPALPFPDPSFRFSVPTELDGVIQTVGSTHSKAEEQPLMALSSLCYTRRSTEIPGELSKRDPPTHTSGIWNRGPKPVHSASHCRPPFISAF